MLCKRGIQADGGRVPCGQCINCRVNQGRKWTSRILMEYVTAGNGVFTTLTYRDQELPGNGKLEKEEITQWVRNRFKVEPFRYYLVGEYGTQSWRPHYHMVVFPHEGRLPRDVTLGWDKGHTSAYPLTPQRAAYCAAYTTKKLVSHSAELAKRDLPPEFRTSSKRPPVGHAFISKLVQMHRTPGGAEYVERMGDVARSWRFGQKVLPIDGYILRKARERLGVPALHSERLTHDGYFATHAAQEHAIWNPEEARIEVERFNAKKKQNAYRYDFIPV